MSGKVGEIRSFCTCATTKQKATITKNNLINSYLNFSPLYSTKNKSKGISKVVTNAQNQK